MNHVRWWSHLLVRGLTEGHCSEYLAAAAFVKEHDNLLYFNGVMRIESSKVLCFHFMITELRLLNQSKYGNKQLSLPEDGKPSFYSKRYVAHGQCCCPTYVDD
jgi:hypothetical protein